MLSYETLDIFCNDRHVVRRRNRYCAAEREKMGEKKPSGRISDCPGYYLVVFLAGHAVIYLNQGVRFLSLHS